MNRSISLSHIEPALRAPITEILTELSLAIHDTAPLSLRLKKGDGILWEKEGDALTLTYGERHEIFRALSHLPRILEGDPLPRREESRTELLCYMADMSRNAVYTLDTAKQMIRYLALMGYDSLMLYTEDTFELPDYPHFGHMRGRFSAEELRALDAYCASFGIELIPCVQTLAHLATSLKWSSFSSFRDTEDILMVGNEETYAFIDAILSQCASCFTSRRINVGMDEAHMLGRGNYLKQNGYRPSSELMLEHLERVVALCRKHGFTPMIWSDMFFRMPFGRYYVKEGEITKDVIDKVPQGLELIYWDYYSTDREVVSHMLHCHKQFQSPTLFAGGAWKWSGFGAHNRFSLAASRLQLDECFAHGVRSIIVTSWGDNGGEASQFSSLATLLYFAERAYGDEPDEAYLNTRAMACFTISFDDLLAFDLPDALPECTVEAGATRPCNPSKYLLYNDIFERFMDCHLNPKTAPAVFAEHAEELASLASHPRFGYAFETLSCLCRVLSRKCDMGIRLHRAYLEDDRVSLGEIASRELPEVLRDTEELLVLFRRQWYRENKTFGFTAHELRLGGLIARLQSQKLRLDAYLAGELSAIEELVPDPLPVKPLLSPDNPYLDFNSWRKTVSAGLL